MTETPIFGICGWKNSGKTTLTCQLVEEFVKRGLKVATVKHAHHSFEIDHPGTDSFKHREAGASEIAIVSRNRWANIRELSDKAEPVFSEVLTTLAPCDLVLVEGYKSERHPKIEAIRGSHPSRPPIWKSNSTIVALASEDRIDETTLPQFNLDQVDLIADFILTYLKIGTSDAAE